MEAMYFLRAFFIPKNKEKDIAHQHTYLYKKPQSHCKDSLRETGLTIDKPLFLSIILIGWSYMEASAQHRGI